MLRHASQHNRRNILAWDLKFPAGECVYSTRETAQAFKCFRSPTLPRNYLEGEGTCSASGALQAVVPQALAHGDIQLGAPRLAQVQGRVDLCLCPLALHHKLGDSIQLWHLRKQHPPLLHSLLGQRRVQQQLIIHNALRTDISHRGQPTKSCGLSRLLTTSPGAMAASLPAGDIHIEPGNWDNHRIEHIERQRKRTTRHAATRS